MTRYFVVVSETDAFFEFGNLYFTEVVRQNGSHLFITKEGENPTKSSAIIPSAILSEVDLDAYNAIKNVPLGIKMRTVSKILQLEPTVGRDILQEVPFESVISKTNNSTPNNLTKEDVWGVLDMKSLEWVSNGMVISRYNERCPYFNDILEPKTVTVVCEDHQKDEVREWLDEVNGIDSVYICEKLPRNKVVMRSQSCYQS